MKCIQSAKLVLPVVLLAVVTVSASADNLVINGSFEQVSVPDSYTWGIYDTLPGWELARGPSIELQRNVKGWNAAEGSQYLELDSDTDGPTGTLAGEAASSAIYQDLATVPGQVYLLTLAFSPRPAVDENVLEIVWDGEVLETLSRSGLGLSSVDWQTHSYEVTAAAATTRLELGDRSASDSFGTLVDDVSLSMIPEPAGLVLLSMGALLSCRRRGY